jgi:AcrB/AcrD/AcrF family
VDAIDLSRSYRWEHGDFHLPALRLVCVSGLGRSIRELVLATGSYPIVPMCLLSAMAGVYFRGQDNNIFTQIGFIVLVGLACKNAILIVEFARQVIQLRPLE